MPKAKPKFTKAYSFGLVTGLFFILSWAGQFIFQMISERNEAEQHGQAFTWSDFFPQFFPPHWRIGSQSSCNSFGKRPDWPCSTFGAHLSRGRAMTDWKPRSIAC